MVDSGPLITRIGVKSDFFDQQIDGLPGDGSGLLSDSPIAMGLFQKCIGVGWGGGATFVTGCFNSSNSTSIFTFTFPNKNEGPDNPKVTGVGNAFGGGGNFGGSALGSSTNQVKPKDTTPPAIIVAGAIDASHTNAIGKIAHSSDFKTFETVYTQPNTPPDGFGASVLGVVWDGSSFWGAGHLSESGIIDPGGADPIFFIKDHDILLHSTNGLSWSEAGRNTFVFEQDLFGIIEDTYPPDFAAYVGLLVSHCDSQVTDSNGHAVPDGFYGNDKDGSVLIKPSSIGALDYVTGLPLLAQGPTTVLRNGKSVDVGIQVGGVAFAGGIWLAVGGPDSGGSQGNGSPEAAYSFDGGETWNIIHGLNGDSNFLTVSGLQIKKSTS